MLIWLAPLFAAVATLYASVGFAGGSTYTALLVLSGVGFQLVPIISLACNIIVASGGFLRFWHASAIDFRRVLPLIAVSVPLAWYGGSLSIDRALFVQLLGISLALAGLLLLASPRHAVTAAPRSAVRDWGILALAAPLGLLSGLVGIGGGIFLAPVLHLMRWDDARRIAGAAALFILVNSLAGLAGQVSKLADTAMLAEAFGWWPLAVAALIGGQLGSLVGARHLPAALIRRVTGIVILLAAARLLTS